MPSLEILDRAIDKVGSFTSRKVRTAAVDMRKRTCSLTLGYSPESPRRSATALLNHNIEIQDKQQSKKFTIQQVSTQLGGLTDYLKHKLRQLTDRKKTSIAVIPFRNASLCLPQQQNPRIRSLQRNINTPSNMHQMRLCNFSQILRSKQKQEYIDPAHLLNVKQRIARLVAMREDQQQSYELLTSRIRKRCGMIKNQDSISRPSDEQKQHCRNKSSIEITNRKQQQLNREVVAIKNTQWDQLWVKKVSDEQRRYRNRLAQKSQHKNVFVLDEK